MQVKDKPSVNYATDDYNLYTLCLIDPDTSLRPHPVPTEWILWLIVNIPGTELDYGDIVNDYIGAGPSKGSGLHRYVFLVYKQPSKLRVDEPRHTQFNGYERDSFKIRNFTLKYNLNEPVAVNFFLAQYDDYVPKLYATLDY